MILCMDMYGVRPGLRLSGNRNVSTALYHGHASNNAFRVVLLLIALIITTPRVLRS